MDALSESQAVKRDQTRALLDRWSKQWAEVGFGPWVVRLRNNPRVIGAGGCSLLGGKVWSLGYRFAAEVQGRGYATELASQGVLQAQVIRPDLPVVASLLEHNIASERVARKLGLERVHRAADTDNPDLSAVRLIYATRPLATDELSAVLG